MKPIERIIDLGAVFFGIGRNIFVSRRRDDPVVRIRFSIMGACRDEGYSLTFIGAAFNRDHGTVINAIKNLNPAAMSELWEKHLKFLEVVKLRQDIDGNQLPDVSTATQLAIQQIDKKLRALQEIRQILTTSMEAISRFESASKVSDFQTHWHDKLP